jgi:enoyl-CoA hydratase
MEVSNEMVRIESHDNVLVATLGRGVQNTIDDAFADAIEHALDEAQRRGAALLHLRTATPHFCGGADPARVARWLEEGGDEALRSDGDRWASLFRRIEQQETIVFAEVKGNALGAGLGLALACDLRIVSAAARIGVPEVRVGLLPAGMTVDRLVGLAGMVAAQRLLLGGDIIDGTEAFRLGLAHWIAPQNELESEADALVKRVAKQSAPALREAKRLLAASRRNGREEAGAVEAQAFHRLINDEEPRDRIRKLLVRLAAAAAAK